MSVVYTVSITPEIGPAFPEAICTTFSEAKDYAEHRPGLYRAIVIVQMNKKINRKLVDIYDGKRWQSDFDWFRETEL